MLVVPSLKHVCQSKYTVRLTACFPCAAAFFLNVLGELSPCCWENLITAGVSSFSVDAIVTLDCNHRALLKIRLRPYALMQWCRILRLRHKIVARQFPGFLCTYHYWKQ